MCENLGELKEVENLKDVWENESKDFTPWLADVNNIKLLSNVIGIDIDVIKTEESVGKFYVDIFANETETDKKIVIENQLEKSDHDHCFINFFINFFAILFFF